jgi:streptogramin lyase
LLEDRCVPAVTATEFAIPTPASSPTSITQAADGNLWFTEFGTDKIGRINATTKVITEFTLPSGSGPLTIISAPDGNLYFTERSSDAIGRINPSAGSDAAIQSSTNATFATVPSGNGPTGIAVGPDGNLYVTEFNTDQIARVALPSGTVSQLATLTAGAGPAGITNGPDGAVWFTEAGLGKIGRITTGGTVTNEFPLAISTSDPENIVTAPNGVLYFTETGEDKVGLITTSGAITEFKLQLGAAPNGITIGADNGVYFAEGGLDRIGRLSLTGNLTEFSSGITTGSQPAGITSGPDNAIWFTEIAGNNIGRLAIPPVGLPTGVGELVVGADTGGGSAVRTFDANGNPLATFTAFPGFNGAVRVTLGDINGDGFLDTIVGAGPGAPGGHIIVFDGKTGAVIRSFFAFPGYTGGVFVASGDVNNDGFDDIIVGADAGAPGGHVEVFDGKTNALIQSFFAFPGFNGGVRVAAGDVNGDGSADIIVGAGPGAPGGHIEVFDGKTNALLLSFLSFPGFSGGMFVGSGDVNGDGFADIIVGAGSGAPNGIVGAFNGKTQTLLSAFFTRVSYTGGVRVASVDVNRDGRADISTIAGPGLSSNVITFDALTGMPLANFLALPGFLTGAFIGNVGR